MATLESDKVEKALCSKMQAERHDAGDWFFIICNKKGDIIASTSISKGSKHTLGEKRVSQMAHQLRLSNSKQMIDLVRCTLSREDALVIMESNPPSINRRR